MGQIPQEVVGSSAALAPSIIPPIARLCAWDIQPGESFEAFPGIHLFANRSVEALKEVIQDGGPCCTIKKTFAYFGYRLISYSFLPTILNLVSIVVCGILSLITLTFRCCETGRQINRWCWTHFQGSCGYTLQSLYDLTCDFRQLTGRCCLPPDSLYLAI